MIVSDHYRQIEHAIVHKIGVGLTSYQSAKGIGSQGKKKEREIIHIIINRIDLRRTYNAIQAVDSEAFIIEFDVNHIKGRTPKLSEPKEE